MARLFIVLLSITASLSVALAAPSDTMMNALSAHVVKVHVALDNGTMSKGSGVVVAKNQVITNCHVVAHGKSIAVLSNGQQYPASAIKTDWAHDLCMVKVQGLDAPVVRMGASQDLQHDQAVFTMGYPSDAPKIVSTFGVVKALYPLDDSVVVRTTSSFKLGASGGAVFDEQGQLVAIITLKSPGKNAYYYNMPVEWVKALFNAPEQELGVAITDYKVPFWNTAQTEWPYFMRVVKPVQTENWKGLLTVAREWTAQEPNNHEAWYYLAVAEHGLKDMALAEQHFNFVLTHNSLNSDALHHLNAIAKESIQDDTMQGATSIHKMSLVN